MVQQSLTYSVGDKLMCNDDIGNLVPREDNMFCVFVFTIKTYVTNRDSPSFDSGVMSVICDEMVRSERTSHHNTSGSGAKTA